MPIFSNVSKARLVTCCPELQLLFNDVVKTYDCHVICGHRSQYDQDKAVLEKKSKLKWPKSKHNKLPSDAVDVIPIPNDYEDKRHLAFFAGYVYCTFENLRKANPWLENATLRWGGNWDGDKKMNPQSFDDFPHFEIIRK